MALDTGRGKLHQAMESLAAHWDEALAIWDDVARRDFEEHYWLPLVPRVSAALRAIDRLGQAIVQMRHDCE